VKRLLLDEHFPPELASMLRSQGFDVLAVAADPALTGMSDSTLYHHARLVGRRNVTENARDFRLLQKQSFAEGEEPAMLLLTTSERFPRHRSQLGKLASALKTWLAQDLPPKAPEEWL
jgi:predicted nuclease of predicted toxin-antitoxin system